MTTSIGSSSAALMSSQMSQSELIESSPNISGTRENPIHAKFEESKTVNDTYPDQKQ